jgi:hypothetical protein
VRRFASADSLTSFILAGKTKWAAAQLDRSKSVSAEATPYPGPIGDKIEPHYSVMVNGTPMDSVLTAMDFGRAHFAFEGKVRIEIKAGERIESFYLGSTPAQNQSHRGG